VVAVLKKAGAGRIGRILLSENAAYLDLQSDELEAVQSQLTEFHLARAHELPAEAAMGQREERPRGFRPSEGRERRRPLAR
jgi:ATP-dependent RNA helicase DeaD